MLYKKEKAFYKYKELKREFATTVLKKKSFVGFDIKNSTEFIALKLNYVNTILEILKTFYSKPAKISMAKYNNNNITNKVYFKKPIVVKSFTQYLSIYKTQYLRPKIFEMLVFFNTTTTFLRKKTIVLLSKFLFLVLLYV